MKTKTILGITLTAVFAVSMIGSAVAVQSWQGIVPSSVTVSSKGQTTTLSLAATSSVPRHTSALAGFAWFYDGGSKTAFALTTHNAKQFAGTHQNPARDSTQNPDGWHAHNVVLANGAGSATFCVADLSNAPIVGLKINNAQVSVIVKNTETTAPFNGHAAAFSIIPEPACGSTIGSKIPLGLTDVTVQ